MEAVDQYSQNDSEEEDKIMASQSQPLMVRANDTKAFLTIYFCLITVLLFAHITHTRLSVFDLVRKRGVSKGRERKRQSFCFSESVCVRERSTKGWIKLKE